ncbi:DegT/DnrJ/EryC1/StrS family aminotransferase [Bradyrhizobium sp. MOS002]|uniref:DegT/DnrJ/EryC1/StrS family aminotransferase n=1 Tax=Bradyrhizobium sp. MOS002 TaxID=2133947 RepID=UPI000D117794|nr:DegT/DnrJ/EryC1/StrS family aminotransferase [Bradyrhizobium sp. MOS002]PSO25973.1 hypothetical protein C7G41_28755 [Bradyrhizobium sp. MOS002]
MAQQKIVLAHELEAGAKQISKPALSAITTRVKAEPAIHSIAKQRITPISYRSLLRTGTIRDEQRFLTKVGERLGHTASAIPVGRARSGIYLLANIAVRGKRRKVLMSPFTIPDVVTMVVLAGAIPVFYDFQARSTACSLDSLEELIDNETACVILTHYHVNEIHLSQIAQICRAYGAYLFDDCALVFGGTIDGHPIGTVTDASVFSLSYFKLVNFFWGGLITTRNPDIAQRLTGIVNSWPRLGPLDYIKPAKACLTYDAASRPALFNAIIFPRIQGEVQRTSIAKSLEPIRIETSDLNPTLTARPSYAAFGEWTAKVGEVDLRLAMRRKIVDIYRRRLGHRMIGADTPSSVLGESSFMNFPVFVPSERCNEIARAMILAGYDVGRTLYPNAHRHPRYNSIQGRTENVDRMVSSTIYLPTHFGVSEQYAEDISTRLAAEIAD